MGDALSKLSPFTVLQRILADTSTAYYCPDCAEVWVMSGRRCTHDTEARMVDHRALERALLDRVREVAREQVVALRGSQHTHPSTLVEGRTRQLKSFADQVLHYWLGRTDREGSVPPRFVPPPLATRFAPDTLRAVARDLDAMADEVEGVGLRADRKVAAQLREMATAAERGVRGPWISQLDELIALLWVHPVQPKAGVRSEVPDDQG